MRSEDPSYSLPADRDERSRGQYMVEFALSFTIFIIFVLIVIDLGLLIYNHNLFYHGVSKGARVASLGGTDNEVKDAVSREVLPSYFPTMLLVAEPEPVTITPDREMHRVDGKEVTVRMDARFGMSMLWFGNVTIGFPIRSSSVIIQNNDQDRDGCKDSLEGPPGGPGWGDRCLSFTRNTPFGPVGTRRQDHFNDLDSGDSDFYLFGGSDVDADSAGDANIPINQSDIEGEDTVVIGYFGGTLFSDSFMIHRPIPEWPQSCGSFPLPTLNVSGPMNGTTWEECFDGDYHAPVMWSSGVEHPHSLFPQSFPTQHVDKIVDADYSDPLTGSPYDTRVLHTVYDFDNDGWEDKYDEFPMDPTRH